MSSEEVTVRVARVRVTIDCPECSSAIPVNGIVDSVLCSSCQAVVVLDDELSWTNITSYGPAERIPELNVLSAGKACSAIDCFLKLLQYSEKPNRLHRRERGVLLEIDDRPPRCRHCKGELEAAALLTETQRGKEPDVSCPHCRQGVALRRAGAARKAIHHALGAIAGETAVRGDLQEASAEPVLFACMGCGAPLKVDDESPRIVSCEFCEGTNYLPDALWLRLHPAQRKQPFWFLLRVTAKTLQTAMRAAP